MQKLAVISHICLGLSVPARFLRLAKRSGEWRISSSKGFAVKENPNFASMSALGRTAVCPYIGYVIFLQSPKHI